MIIKKLNTDQRKKIILSVFFGLILIHVIFIFSGFYNDDDINYSRYAADIINGNIHNPAATDHFQLRWSTIYSTAFFYYLFGINAFTSAIPCLLSFIFCGVLLYKMLLKEKSTIFFLTIIFFYFNRTSVFYMHRLLGDPIMCFAIFFMYFSYRTYFLDQSHAIKRGFLFAISFMLAIITKETIIIVAPLFIAFLVKDIIRKQCWQFWKYAILFFAFFVCIYLLYFKVTTGDFFYRYNLLIHTNEISMTSFENITLVSKLKRIGYGLWNAWLLNGDMLLYIPAVSAVVYRSKMRNTFIDKIDSYSFLILVCCANFMTISFSYYIPLPESPRHFIFVLPFASLLAGKMLFEYFSNPIKFTLLPVLLFIATIIVFTEHAGTIKYMYLLFSIITISRYFLAYYYSSTILKYYVFALSCLFSLNYLKDFYDPMYPVYFDQKKVLDSVFADKNIKGTIYSANAFASEMNEYFLSFKTERLKFLPIDSLSMGSNKNLYYYINSDENRYEKKILDKLLKEKNGKSISLIFSEKNCYLYNIGNDALKILKDSAKYTTR